KWDPTQDACRCASDACCPSGFRFVDDGPTGTCACASQRCCPADFAYDPTVQACVCVGTSCCPPNFALVNGRCLCQNDAACAQNPGSLKCDLPSGVCKCASTTQ